MDLENQVIRMISPTRHQRQEIKATVDMLLARVASEISKEKLPLEIRMVGSVAKDTYIYPPDIDIFILFPPEVARSDLEEVGLRIGKGVLGGEERYAEHPYIHGRLGDFEVDLVPCYRVQGAHLLKSAVDRTPFHTEYVRRMLSEKQKDQVRLLKRFMKGVGVYGAEAKVRGFSGYLAELLVIRYGDFASIMEAAAHWKAGMAMGIEPFEPKEFGTPLVFYDPVDQTRNVSSALSIDSFARFVYACQEYQKKPDIRFFFPQDRRNWTLSKIRSEAKKRETTLLIVTFDRPSLTDDNLYPQVRKALDAMADLLVKNDFEVLDKTYHVGERLSLAFELLHGVLPAAKKHRGPPVWIDQSANFLTKWERDGLTEPFIEEGRWMVMIPREYPSSVALLNRKAGELSVGSDLKGLNGIEVTFGTKMLRSENRAVLTELLDKSKPWNI
jgi:tRNA nucleotidyltransferase (CCA-adding enzyme)